MAEKTLNRSNIEIIKKIAHKELSTLIKKCPGDKALVWDRALANPLNLVAEHSDFKNYGVVKMLSLEPGLLPPTDVPETVIFICRPIVNLMPLVASCIRNEERQMRRKKFYLFFIPRTSYLCQKWLDDHNVLNSLMAIEEVPILLFPLDNDVLSMELDYSFKEFNSSNDPTSLHLIAKALVFILKKFESTPNTIYGKGDASKYVYDLMQSIKNETPNTKSNISESKIENIILIDRQIDLLSPMVTQLTYEGLIDEFFGINNNHVKFPEEKFGKPKSMVLHSSEILFAELRDKNFSAIGGILREKTKEIQDILKQKDRDLHEMKRLVQQLPAVNALKESLSNHTSIAELIKIETESDEFLSSLECEQELLNGMDTEKINSHIEYLCSKQVSLSKLLRLIIIQNITSGGLRPKILQHYERLILQNYGFENILTLLRLQECGLLRSQPGSRYSVLRRLLHLTVCDGSETKPDDFSYVHSIYAPLSIRLVQNRLKPNSWGQLKDSISSLLPGPTVDESFPSNTSSSIIKRGPKLTLVVFIGGCTFAEISALRFLAQQDDENEFLIVTTKVINGNTFLKCLFETIEKPL